MNRIISIILLLSTLFCSCTKQRLEATFSKQESKIESFIKQQTQKDGVNVVYSGGSDRIILIPGEGEELASDGTVTFFYAGYVFNGNLNAKDMFATNHKQTAIDSGWSSEEEEGDFEAVTLNLKDDEMVPGLRNGLVGVKAGEECYILFSGKHGFGNKNFGIVEANSALIYHIWVASISNE